MAFPITRARQMADSTPVPVSDLEPGDLLFYGPGGSEHVAMYIGPGAMIEAPYTGQSVGSPACDSATASSAPAVPDRAPRPPALVPRRNLSATRPLP